MLPQGAATGIAVLFLIDEPTFFALKDGDEAWKEISVSASSLTADILDPDGRYAFAAYGDYRGGSRGYYVESTLDDSTQHDLKFDDTSDTITYTINAEANNFDAGGGFAIGVDYRLAANFTPLPAFPPGGSESFSVDLTQDADEPDSGDAMFVLANGSFLHTSLPFKDYTDSSTLSYTAAPADAHEPFDVDHSAIRNSSGYQGLALKISGDNLKALLREDFGTGDDVTELDKFPTDADQIFALSARWEFAGTDFDEDLKYSRYYDEPPPAVTLDQAPARAPDVTVGADNNYSLRLDYSGIYSSGISGLENVVRGARAGDWRMYQTRGRYQVGAQVIGFDADLLALPGFPAGTEPEPTNLARASLYETNRTAQDELRFLYSGHEASAANDGMIRLRLNMSF